MWNGASQPSRDLPVWQGNAARDADKFLAQVVAHLAVRPVLGRAHRHTLVSIVLVLVPINRAEHAQGDDSGPQCLIGNDIFSPADERQGDHTFPDPPPGDASRHPFAEVGPYPPRGVGKRSGCLVVVGWAKAVLGADVAVLPTGSWTDFLGPDHDLACRGPESDGKEVELGSVERVDILHGSDLLCRWDVEVENLVDGLAFPHPEPFFSIHASWDLTGPRLAEGRAFQPGRTQAYTKGRMDIPGLGVARE